MKKHRGRRSAKWLWSRKFRVATIATFILVAGYSGVHAAVSTAKSNTDKLIELNDGRRLAYRVVNPTDDVQSTRQRLILVHGAPADATSWRRLLDAHVDELSSFEIVVVDRLGYGNSTTESEESLEAHAASLEPLLTPGCILVGHSYGGPVVLRAAADFPGLIGGIVIAAGACDPYMNDAQWFRQAVDAAELVTPQPWTNANRELLALTDDNQAMIELVDQVTCRVAVIHGTWDPVCPHDGTVGYLRESLTNAADIRVQSLPRAGHNVHLSHPEEIVTLVKWIAPDTAG